MEAVHHMLCQVSHLREGVRGQVHHAAPHLHVPVGDGCSSAHWGGSAIRERIQKLAVSFSTIDEGTPTEIGRQ